MLTPYSSTVVSLFPGMSNTSASIRVGLAVLAPVLRALAPSFAMMQPASSPLVFLTRDGCANTTTMRTRLDQALTRLKMPTDYDVLDVDTLSDSDVRRGYGTPTVLYQGRDLFGAPAPTLPLPAPT
jgi:hypothetical protein